MLTDYISEEASISTFSMYLSGTWNTHVGSICGDQLFLRLSSRKNLYYLGNRWKLIT